MIGHIYGTFARLDGPEDGIEVDEGGFRMVELSGGLFEAGCEPHQALEDVGVLDGASPDFVHAAGTEEVLGDATGVERRVVVENALEQSWIVADSG